MAEEDIEKLGEEIAGLRALVMALIDQLRSAEPSDTAFNAVPIRASELMNGFQAAMARSNQADRAASAEGAQDIENFLVRDLEVEFAAPLVAERDGEEPILMVPNIKSVSQASPLVRLKFTVSSVPPKE